ncbi:MAG: nitroreductase family protein [Methanomicrobiales archaeon]|jgi:nitroreductase|nr:nitroreductase family protein [Methanomicrobiales archaeon]
MNLGSTLIKSRRSVRKYQNTPVSDVVIKEVFECARLAPSARNSQPWIFGAIRDKEMLNAIAKLADNGVFIADAPICFAVFGDVNQTYYLEDCCAATENMIICLQGHGIGSCWVAGDKKGYVDAVTSLLKVPEPYKLVSLIPAGVPAEISSPPKKAVEDVTFFEVWGDSKK